MRGVEVWLDIYGDVKCRATLSSEPGTEVGDKGVVGMRMRGTVTPTRRKEWAVLYIVSRDGPLPGQGTWQQASEETLTDTSASINTAQQGNTREHCNHWRIILNGRSVTVTRLQWYRGLCGGVGPCEGVVSCIIGTLLWRVL
jgi:hypothetical protein